MHSLKIPLIEDITGNTVYVREVDLVIKIKPRSMPTLPCSSNLALRSFGSHNSRCPTLNGRNDAQKQIQTEPASLWSRKFHELLTEIHHLIAPHLPDHALQILARYGYDGRIREVYQKIDSTWVRHNMKTVSRLESSIFEELRTRNDLEKALYSCKRLSPFHHAQLSDNSKLCTF